MELQVNFYLILVVKGDVLLNANHYTELCKDDSIKTSQEQIGASRPGDIQTTLKMIVLI
jgi:hypothetical protein